MPDRPRALPFRPPALRIRAAIVAIAAPLLAASPALASPPAGTLADPVIIDELPFAMKGTTVGAPADLDAYACNAALDESGGERVFRLDLPAAARLTAWVDGDGGAVDVDIHVLSGATVAGGVASECVSRANVITEADLEAGAYYVVVDSYGGPAQEGPFVLHVDAIPGDTWVEREYFEGVVWRAKRYASYAGGPQVVHELVVDPKVPGTSIRSRRASGCQTTAAQAEEIGAVAAVNGGYFAVQAGCSPVSLIKESGALVATNGVDRGAFGLDPNQNPLVAIVKQGQDWPAAWEAQGGGPLMLSAGSPLTDEAGYAAEGIVAPSFIGANPRTLAGFDASGRIALVGVDGRRPNAHGMSLPSLAQYGKDLGLVDAVNLDGGGSSTVWVRGATPSGVVNYPSDAGKQEFADHHGSRAVSGGFFVFAKPKNHPPRLIGAPPALIDPAAPPVHDADAYDFDVDDVLVFSIEGAPAGMAIDPATGVVTWDAPDPRPKHVTATIVVRDGRGGEASQAIDADVVGGVDPDPGAGGAGGAGGGAGSGGTAAGGASTGAGGATAAGGAGVGGTKPEAGPATPASDAGGCGCRAAAGVGGSSPIALLAMGLAALLRRRASARRSGQSNVGSCTSQ